MATSPINLETFDLIDSYLEWGDPERLVDFCETIFSQFYRQVFGQELGSFDDRTKRQALELLDRAKPKTPEMQALVASLLDFCDTYENGADLRYGIDPQDPASPFRVFHDHFIVRLLERLQAWADSLSAEDLSARIAATQIKYAQQRW
jgi:hypothetical protein